MSTKQLKLKKMIAQILIFFFKVAVIIAARFVIKVMIPKWGKDKKISVSTDGLMTIVGVILFAEFLMAKVLEPAGYKAIVPFVEMVLPTLWILWMEIKRNAKLHSRRKKRIKKEGGVRGALVSTPSLFTITQRLSITH
jgi:hypothetical protein